MVLNRENIKLVRDHIAALSPEQFDMENWATQDGMNMAARPHVLLEHPCNTCGCIGGWAEALLYKTDDQRRSTENVGRRLGLTEEQSDALFHPAGVGNWRSITIPQAVAVLDHLLETGEVDWSVAEKVAA